MLTLKSVVVAEAVDDAMAKRVVAVPPALACKESFAYGEVVASPKLPVEVITIELDEFDCTLKSPVVGTFVIVQSATPVWSNRNVGSAPDGATTRTPVASIVVL